jgi:hypothetical protein
METPVEVLVKSTQEQEERPDAELKIARFFPLNSNHIAEIVGIPFEANQFKGIQIHLDELNVDLEKLMHSLKLIGVTQGVPHLSIGGSTRGYQESLNGVDKPVMEPQSSRSYLYINNIGVQGTGLVQYDNASQLGFGLGEPFLRPNGVYDTGGGLAYYTAEASEREGNKLWMLSLLHFGKPSFARVFKRLDFSQGLYKRSEAEPERVVETNVLIREDGQREVPRQQLRQAIWDLIPMICKHRILPNASFSNDGHNAFLKDGKVIFTDYEEITSLYGDPIDFMYKFNDQYNLWWFEGLRKNFPQFCTILGLTSSSDTYRVNSQTLLSNIQYALEQSTVETHKVDFMNDLIKSNDYRDLMRCAMAGVMGSYSRGIYGSRKILSGVIKSQLIFSNEKKWTLNKMLETLSENDFPKDTSRFIQNDPSGMHLLYADKETHQLRFRFSIDNYGLPIDQWVDIPVTQADIFEAWPESDGNKQSLELPAEIQDNPFADISEDILSKTPYCQISSCFAQMRELAQTGTNSTKDVVYHQIEKFNQNTHTIVKQTEPNPDENLETLTIECNSTLIMIISPKKGQITIESNQPIQNTPLAELNKYAYIAHILLLASYRDHLEGEHYVSVNKMK